MDAIYQNYSMEGTRTLNSSKKKTLDELRNLMSSENEVSPNSSSIQSLQGPVTPRVKSSSIQWGPIPGEEKPDSTRTKELKTAASLKLGRALSAKLKRISPGTIQPANLKPIQKLDKETQRYLDSLCKKSIHFLERLQQPPYSRRAVEKDPILPKTALRFSKGLAFMWQRKAGLVGSYTWGFGFLIARLGPNHWSPPLFLQDNFISLGASFGFRYVNTFYALPTDQAFDNFKYNQITMNLDLAITMGIDPSAVDAPTAVLSTDRISVLSQDPLQPKAYAISDGAILDVSLRWGMHSTDVDLNAKIYGENTTVDEILGGKVMPLEQFSPLYDMIALLSANANVIRTVRSEFETMSRSIRSSEASQHNASGSGASVFSKLKRQYSRSLSDNEPSTSSLTSMDAARWSPAHRQLSTGSTSMEGSTVNSLKSLPEEVDSGAEHTITGGSDEFSLFPNLPEIDVDLDDEGDGCEDDEKGKEEWKEKLF